MQPKEFIAAFYQAIVDKRLEDITSAYLDSEETYVILEGPRLATKGFSRIAQGWRDFCDSRISLQSITWLEGPFLCTFTDSASLAGVMQLCGSIGDKSFEQIFRGSFVLALTPDGFKIAQEHVSGALPDPYGIGDWKKS